MTMIDVRAPEERGAGPWPGRTSRAGVRGRAAERDATRALLRRAERGGGGVLLVDGEPGAGKSLLLHHCVDEAAERGFSLAAGTGSRLERALPLATLRGAMPGLFAAGPREDEAGPGMTSAADATRWWTDRIREFLRRRAAAGPVLVCLDDLQWACPGTLAVVRALARDLRGDRVAWLLARSDTFASAAVHAFRSLEADGACRLALQPLDASTVSDLLAGAFGAPPDEALADLARGAAGNPSLIMELVSGLREDGGVHVTGGRAVLASDRLPAGLTRLAGRRLARLSAGARHLAALAAVLDPEFRIEDTAAMLAETSAAVLPALEETIAAGIVTAAGHAFAFRHPLLRRAAAELIPAPARLALYRQYGQILLTRNEAAVRAASYLLRAACPGDRGSAAGLDSAVARVASVSPGAAADLAVRALDLTPPISPAAVPRAVAAAESLAAAGRLADAGRVARETLARPVPAVAEGRLRCVLSSVLCATGSPREAALLADLVLAERELPAEVRGQAVTARLQALAGVRDPLARPAADSVLAAPGQHGPRVRAAALAARARADLDRGRIGDGIGRLREAARDGGVSPDVRDAQSPLLLAAALTDLRLLPEAEEAVRAAAGQALDGTPAGAVVRLLRARTGLAAGRADEAAADAQAARDLAQGCGAGGLAAAACCVLAVTALRRGDLAAGARHLADRPVAGPQFADVYARAETAFAAVQVSEARDGAVAVAERIRELAERLGDRPGLLLGDPAAAAWLARIAVAGGDTELGIRVVGAAAGLADRWPAFTALAAAAEHARGVACQDPAALANAADRQPDPWGRASAAEDLAVLHGCQGGKAEALRWLKEAEAGYGQAGAERDTARVRRRLRALGVRHRHWAVPAGGPVTGWNALTPTEQAVARLVAEGLSNGEAAASMYISTHTVAHHLRQSYRKLAIASRVELTRIVLQTGDSAG
jgi:DNA-binding CsgD family transcriptional regulator